MILDAFDYNSAALLPEDLLFIISLCTCCWHIIALWNWYGDFAGISQAPRLIYTWNGHTATKAFVLKSWEGIYQTNPWVLLKRNLITAEAEATERSTQIYIFFILSAVSLLKHNISSVFSLSGRQNSSGVWRRGAACCSACSTSHRPMMAMCRAKPRRGLVAGCAWGSNDVPTWLPWTSTVIQTPTLKRKAHSCVKQHLQKSQSRWANPSFYSL